MAPYCGPHGADQMSTKEFAEKSNILIGSITPLLQAMEFPDGDRINLSLSLVKSSIDLGFAATTLIATDHSNNGMGALVLMRPQLEHLFRGIYLGSMTLATDEFVSKFLASDKWNGPDFQTLSKHAAEVLAAAPMGANKTNWNKLPNMVQFVKNQLHGFVHGGIAVEKAYWHETGIAFSPEHFDNGQTITNITSAAMFGFSFAQSICIPSGNGRRSELDSFLEAYSNWKSFLIR
jgi:hypothetical protein